MLVQLTQKELHLFEKMIKIDMLHTNVLDGVDMHPILEKVLVIVKSHQLDCKDCGAPLDRSQFEANNGYCEDCSKESVS